jgi:hypothetical protein
MLLILLLFYASQCFVGDSLQSYAWQSSGFLDQQDFPEQESIRFKTAIGFSGGGTRAFAAAFGALSGLHILKLVENIQYIGGVSGGAWATIVYTYAQNVSNDSTFLGRILPPDSININSLKGMNQQCARRLAHNEFIAPAIEALKKGTAKTLPEAWTIAIQSAYLDDVGIPKSARFSWNASTILDVKRRNPHLESESFVAVASARKYTPFPIISSAIVGPSADAPYGPRSHNLSMLEFTPLYVGQMSTRVVDYKCKQGVGKRIGGAIEPFAFARTGRAPPPYSGLSPGEMFKIIKDIPDPEIPLDLAYALSASSYAPGLFFESLPSHYLAAQLGLPMDYWSPAEPSPKVDTMLLSDGAALDNLPIVSFLQRRVKKMVLFFNSEVPLQPIEKWNVYKDKPSKHQIALEISSYFGIYPADAEHISYDYRVNQIFPEREYPILIQALQRAQQRGKGILATLNLTTVENRWRGISGGITSQITFVYLGRLREWESRLSPEMQQLIIPSPAVKANDFSEVINTGPFKYFPNYHLSGGGETYSRINLLADLVGWSVLQNAQTFRDALSS